MPHLAKLTGCLSKARIHVAWCKGVRIRGRLLGVSTYTAQSRQQGCLRFRAIWRRQQVTRIPRLRAPRHLPQPPPRQAVRVREPKQPLEGRLVGAQQQRPPVAVIGPAEAGGAEGVRLEGLHSGARSNATCQQPR